MIQKVEYNNYANIGDLKLDFTKNDGTAFKYIVIAGENGTGKTTILDSIATFLNKESMKPFNSIYYTVENTPFLIEPVQEKNYSENGFHERKNIRNNKVTRIIHGTFEDVENDRFDIRAYGFSYSKARSGFNTKIIKSTTTSQLDYLKHDNDNNDDFTSIKQLIVDLDTQDNSDWMDISISGKDIAFDDFLKKYSKLQRFKMAFNNFFDNLKFERSR